MPYGEAVTTHALFFLAGCIPAVPPAAHFTPVVAGSVAVQPTTSVEVSTMPALAVTQLVPVPGAPILAFDARAQGSLSYGSIGPGLWLRTRGAQHDGFHLGFRLGGDVGTGDIGGFLPWQMPFAGGSFSAQAAHGYQETGAFAVTFTMDVQVPFNTTDVAVLVEDTVSGDILEVIPIPAFYNQLDLRLDAPIADRVAFSVGGGLYLLTVVPGGYLSTGLRF